MSLKQTHTDSHGTMGGVKAGAAGALGRDGFGVPGSRGKPGSGALGTDGFGVTGNPGKPGKEGVEALPLGDGNSGEKIPGIWNGGSTGNPGSVKAGGACSRRRLPPAATPSRPGSQRATTTTKIKTWHER